MSPRSSTVSYPAFAHIGLRENPGKNLNQITCPDRESNSGHLVSRPDALTDEPWEDNIKMDLREMGYDDGDWINLAQDRDQIAGLCEGGNEPRGSLKASSEFQSLGRAIVKEDEYEEVRWDGIVSIVS
ncbi:hypothetical protein ANN_15621 [Periplaneta americana]|uniref:Uncharacterized protein n=1 Tax=Periplaneta americana TaxID=6978 RepID=A0ABQ8SGY8_PERAM|nr:hypothetical protein ANN_15621 [Periplaneta americana]